MSKIIYCPFLKTDLADKKGQCRLSCEHGMLVFYNRESVRGFVNKYCGSPDGWKGCSLASSLMDYYEGGD
ncbi:MAG: hypothetical protein ACI4R6_01400 [Lachnospiraceae bacterium]